MKEENQDNKSLNTKKYIKIFCLILSVILIIFVTYMSILSARIKEDDYYNNDCLCGIFQDFDTVEKVNGGKLHCTSIDTCSCGEFYRFCQDFFIHPYTGTAKYLSSGKVVRTVEYENGFAQRNIKKWR